MGGGVFIVRIQGGLGNQMFQFALSAALTERTGIPCRFDLTSYSRDRLRQSELSSFRVDLPAAGPLERSHMKYGWGEYLRAKALRRPPRPSRAYLKETRLGFDPVVAALDQPAYLDGYWQSERYFLEVRETVRRGFTLREPLPALVQRIAEEILTCEAVGIHVRRGDYVSNPANHSIFHVQGVDYYLQSARYIASHSSAPKFFVFSDDPDWVRDSLLPRLGGPAVSVPPSENPVHDLHLMSLCRHNVIANSSFSWWGAWLNPNPGKIVIAPRKWFSDPARSDADLIPDAWLRTF